LSGPLREGNLKPSEGDLTNTNPFLNYRIVLDLASREAFMGHYEPQTVSALASVVEDVCKGLNGSKPLSPEMKSAIAKRILELYESGITDPDELRLGVMADSLWASSRTGLTT
jgi:hypothetical protein